MNFWNTFLSNQLTAATTPKKLADAPASPDELVRLQQLLTERIKAVDACMGYSASTGLRDALSIVDAVIRERQTKSLREAGYG